MKTPLQIDRIELIKQKCSNFYRDLLKMFQEIHYWERLMFETPHYAVDVYNKREDLRGLREHVMLVVRDYNRCKLIFIFFKVPVPTVIFLKSLFLKKSFGVIRKNLMLK